MTEENKVETKPTETKPAETNEVKKTIGVDIDGIAIEVDLETGKKIIEARQKAKKEVATLKEQVTKVEEQMKTATQRAQLLEAMKSSDIESVKAQVAQEYLDKINKYENKIFKGEVKSILASQGVLADALEDATTLALKDAKVALDGDIVKINDKDAKEYLGEWVKAKQHLVAVKTPEAKKTGSKPSAPPKEAKSGSQALRSGLGKFIK